MTEKLLTRTKQTKEVLQRNYGYGKITFFHAQQSIEFIIKTIVGILTFISRINTTSDSFKARNISIFQHFSFYEQWKFHAHLSSA